MRLLATKALASLLVYCGPMELGVLSREDVGRYLVSTLETTQGKMAKCKIPMPVHGGRVGSQSMEPFVISTRLINVLARMPIIRPMLLKCGLRERLVALTGLNLSMQITTMAETVLRSLSDQLLKIIPEKDRKPVLLDGDGWETARARHAEFERTKKCAWCMKLQSAIEKPMKKCAQCKVPHLESLRVT